MARDRCGRAARRMAFRYFARRLGQTRGLIRISKDIIQTAMRCRILFVLLLSVAFGPQNRAAERFSAAVSGYSIGGCYFLAFPLPLPSVEWVVEPTERTLQRWSDDTRSIASSDGGTVFAMVNKPRSGLRIAILELDRTASNNGRRDFFDGLADYYAGPGIAVAKNGRVFAVVRPVGGNGQPGPFHIAVISGDSTLERLVPAAGTVSKITVAADNCTIFYTDGAVIRRLNACTGASLPVFTTADETVTDVAALANGEVLVTTSSTLRRFSAGGVPVKTFSIRGVSQYSLDAVAVSTDDSVVVVAAMGYCQGRGQLIALSAADGHELWRRETQNISAATGLAVGSLPAAIPALSRLSLIALSAVLAAAGLATIRR